MRRSYNFVLSNCIWRLNRTKTNKTDRSRIKYTPLSGTIDEINRKRAYRVIWNHSLLFSFLSWELDGEEKSQETYAKLCTNVEPETKEFILKLFRLNMACMYADTWYICLFFVSWENIRELWREIWKCTRENFLSGSK